MTEFIQFEKVQGQYGQFGLITLNRPQALNALNDEMILALHDILDECEKDASTLAVLVQSSSEKAFCAGGDIRALYEGGLKRDPAVLDFFKHEYQLNAKIHHYKKPYISFLNGITMGGGVGISLHGSHAIAGENFRFAMPETTIGLFPDIGSMHLLHQCPGVFGLYLGLTGARLGRDDAHALNLLDYCVDVDQQQKLIEQLYQLDLREEAKSKVSVLLEQFHTESTEDTIFHRLPWVQEVFSEKSVEKILSHFKHYVENCPEADNHAEVEKIYNDIRIKSPSSLKITFEQFQRTQFFSVDECLKTDYTLVAHFLQSKDLYEGIRALIIEKDNQPQWNPATLEAVSTETVDAYFKSI